MVVKRQAMSSTPTLPIRTQPASGDFRSEWMISQIQGHSVKLSSCCVRLEGGKGTILYTGCSASGKNTQTLKFPPLTVYKYDIYRFFFLKTDNALTKYKNVLEKDGR